MSLNEKSSFFSDDIVNMKRLILKGYAILKYLRIRWRKVKGEETLVPKEKMDIYI